MAATSSMTWNRKIANIAYLVGFLAIILALFLSIRDFIKHADWVRADGDYIRTVNDPIDHSKKLHIVKIYTSLGKEMVRIEPNFLMIKPKFRTSILYNPIDTTDAVFYGMRRYIPHLTFIIYGLGFLTIGFLFSRFGIVARIWLVDTTRLFPIAVPDFPAFALITGPLIVALFSTGIVFYFVSPSKYTVYSDNTQQEWEQIYWLSNESNKKITSIEGISFAEPIFEQYKTVRKLANIKKFTITEYYIRKDISTSIIENNGTNLSSTTTIILFIVCSATLITSLSMIIYSIFRIPDEGQKSYMLGRRYSRDTNFFILTASLFSALIAGFAGFIFAISFSFDNKFYFDNANKNEYIASINGGSVIEIPKMSMIRVDLSFGEWSIEIKKKSAVGDVIVENTKVVLPSGGSYIYNIENTNKYIKKRASRTYRQLHD